MQADAMSSLQNRSGSRSHLWWIAPLIVTVAFVAVGCYTVLRHPITESEGPSPTQAHPQEYYRQNCLDCHQDYANYPYGYFYGEYPSYYFDYPRWGYYYAYPWWWDRGWYQTDNAGTQTADQTESPKAARRGGLVPPYVEHAPATWTPDVNGGGYVAPGTTTSSGKGGTGPTTGGAGGNGAPTKTRVKMGSATSDSTAAGDDNKQEEGKKATRRGGAPPPPQ